MEIIKMEMLKIEEGLIATQTDSQKVLVANYLAAKYGGMFYQYGKLAEKHDDTFPIFTGVDNYLRFFEAVLNKRFEMFEQDFGLVSIEWERPETPMGYPIMSVGFGGLVETCFPNDDDVFNNRIFLRICSDLIDVVFKHVVHYCCKSMKKVWDSRGKRIYWRSRPEISLCSDRKELRVTMRFGID